MSVNHTAQRRKAHRKSRNGCQECKRRRIKCDEHKPQCTSCERHDVACVYNLVAHRSEALHGASAATTPHSQPSQHSTPNTASPETSHVPHIYDTAEASSISINLNASPTTSTFSLNDLSLLHHWTLSTSLSILRTPQIDHFWQTIFPAIGFKHVYVIHSILSISALHDAHLHPSHRQKRIHDATHHHTLALQGFRQALDDLGPHNADAIFASAILAFFYAFVTFGSLYNPHDISGDAAQYTACVLGEEWIPLIRGLSTVLQTVYDQVQSGPLKAFLDIGSWFEVYPDNSPPSSDDQRMQDLKAIWQDSEHSQIYDEALLYLRRTRIWMTKESMDAELYNQGWSGPFIWAFLVPEKFFELQKQRQPQALVLFAYYGAVLQRMDGFWWMRGCGKCIVEVVDKCLGRYWERWMEWPKEVVGIVT